MKIINFPTTIALLAVGLTLATNVFAQNTNSDSQARATNGTEMPASNAMVLVDPARIYNESPMSWVGKQVVLQTVTVEDTNNSGNFWIGSDNDHRLLVVKAEGNDNLKAMSFHKGDVITIWGSVKAASRYMAEKNAADSGAMHDAQKTSGVFLLADKVDVNSSTHK